MKFNISNCQARGERITLCTQQSRTRLPIHRVQKRLPHSRAPRIRRDLRHRRCNLRALPRLPARVDLLQILCLPRLIAVRPLHIGSTRAPGAASAGLVQLGVERHDAIRDRFEDGGHVGVAEVEVQSGGFANEGEFGSGQRHGGWGAAAEELRFESVQVRF